MRALHFEVSLKSHDLESSHRLQIDAGTMSPYEHGECFVLDDGGECDLDMGNYERFLDTNMTKVRMLVRLRSCSRMHTQSLYVDAFFLSTRRTTTSPRVKSTRQ